MTLPYPYAAPWQRSLDFHGHACPGLAMGCRMAVDALALLRVDSSVDEELACVAENDACGLDAVQCITACTMGKGNLILRLTGKHAFTFYDRTGGKAWRLVWTAVDMPPREERIPWIFSRKPEDLYMVQPASLPFPNKARLYASHPCARCGEMTAEPFIRLQVGAFFCPDCLSSLCPN